MDIRARLFHLAGFAQAFAACFLMPASKVGAIIEKEFGSILSDRYKLLQLEAAKKKHQIPNRGKR
jgi:Zn-dependent peptidase ImmA (M78 family)